MSIDETEVTITRNKTLLAKLKQERETTNGNDGISSRGHVADRTGSNLENAGRIANLDRGNQGGTQGNARATGASEGLRGGIRQVDGAGIDTNQGTDSGNGYAKSGLRVVESPEEKEARQRELTRQRVQRYRDARRTEKAEREAGSVTLRDMAKAGPQFHLKNPFAKGNEKVKLFSDKEAGDEVERMKDIYFRGSGLLDDVLEIIVKDHEPVQIWQLSQEEAEMLATMHLERAKKDEGAARAARKLLEIYDRLYIWMIAVPRIKKTGSHIAEHKGLGFR